MASSSGFDKFVTYINMEINLLFQRLNYFLIGSAFLVTAFATLVAASKGQMHGIINDLGYMISFVGFYLSIFFTYINYLNTRIILHKIEYIKRHELDSSEKKNAIQAYKEAEDIVTIEVWTKELNNNQLNLVFNMFKETFTFLGDNFKSLKSAIIAPHTYWIPLGFSVFWVILFFVVVASCWQFNLVFFSPLMLWLAYCIFRDPFLKLMKSLLDRRHTNQSNQ